ncbi:MAG: hypothetical protein K6343_01755, partial [Caldisericaceae bacterium]
MKKLLLVLVVFFFLQTVLPTLKSFPTTQTRANAFEHAVLNVGSIDVAKEIGGKDVDIKSHNVSSTIQDYSKDIKTSDVTNVFKQSIKTTTLS